MPTQEQLKIIATRTSSKINSKKSIWKLISDSYAGGETYIKSNNLFQYVKEGSPEHKNRKARSVFLNHVQPIADTLAGFIFSHDVKREVPSNLNYIIEKASKGKCLDAFMQIVATHSMMYTTAILVDSPSFNPEEIRTANDRNEAGLNPYCVMYYPWQIRDFHLDDEGELEWIILDDCGIDSSDPFSEEKKKELYSLWTRDSLLRVEVKKDEEKKDVYSVEKELNHNLGIVPVVLSNFRDADDDSISETPFEDIALLDRAIYNYLSYLDEMIAAGTFKMLFVPIEKESDLPKELITQGVSNLTVFPYNGKLSNSPEFKGAGLDSIEPFIKVIELYLKEIFNKVGLDKDQEKAYVQSGVAKALEYKKAESFLSVGADQLEETEKKIFRILSKWEGMTDADANIEIEYQEKFTEEELDTTITRLMQMNGSIE